MPRLGTTAAIALAALSAAALAGEVPLPVKKPRDATGAPAVDADALPVNRTPVLPMPPGRQPDAEKSAGTLDRGSKTGPASKGGTEADAKTRSKAGEKSKSAEDTGKTTGGKAAAGHEGKDKPKEAPKVLTEWPAEEIQLARARCAVVLKDVEQVSIPEAPFRENECGAPAPVRLISLGKGPEVTFDPPALLTCDMVASLAKWLKGDLQPLAKKHLGNEIIKIQSMSDYSCRNAYGRTTTKLSEHGRANALDIRGFVTAKGERAYVLEGWGPTERDIAAARLAAEKAAAKAAEERAAAEAAASKDPSPETASSTTPLKRGTIVEGVPREAPTAASPQSPGKGMGLAPSQLGGPKDKEKDNAGKKSKKKADKTPPVIETKPADIPTLNLKRPPAATSRFLKEAHAAACRIFGTTLGPEANNAHRNHFHVDMAPRKHKLICD